MQNVTINPHRQPRANELDVAGRPRVSTIITAITTIWLAALVVAAIGYRVGSGDWPGFVDGVLLPLTYGVVALPGGLVSTLVPAGLGVIALPLGLLFWPLVLGLQVAACYRRRWRFLAPVGLLVALAAWNWIVVAQAMMSV
jgi:hypothetical protein